jgi:hypothetical protein
MKKKKQKEIALKYPLDICCPGRRSTGSPALLFFVDHWQRKEAKETGEGMSCGYFKAIHHPENGCNSGVNNNLSSRDPGSIVLDY